MLYFVGPCLGLIFIDLAITATNHDLLHTSGERISLKFWEKHSFIHSLNVKFLAES